jgi:hypothetical protein
LPVNVYLINRCIVESHPKTTYPRKGTHWDYDHPELIRLSTERNNIRGLRRLLARLKLPADIPLKK